LLDRIRANQREGVARSTRQSIVFSPENRARLTAHFDQARAPGINQGGGEVRDTWDLWFDEAAPDVCDVAAKNMAHVEGSRYAT